MCGRVSGDSFVFCDKLFDTMKRLLSEKRKWLDCEMVFAEVLVQLHKEGVKVDICGAFNFLSLMFLSQGPQCGDDKGRASSRNGRCGFLLSAILLFFLRRFVSVLVREHSLSSQVFWIRLLVDART